jgi:hypothetical protein
MQSDSFLTNPLAISVLIREAQLVEQFFTAVMSIALIFHYF